METLKLLKTKAFSSVEVLLAGTILAVVITATFSAIIYSNQTQFVTTNRQKAIAYAKEGIEAVRNIRDNDFSDITAGTYGLTKTNGYWEFSGSSDTNGIYTRGIEITMLDSNTAEVISTVTWNQNLQRTGEVILTTQLTNWKDMAGVSGTCSEYCIGLGSYEDGTCRQNTTQCNNNNETYESEGNAYCTGGPSSDTCCCKPTTLPTPTPTTTPTPSSTPTPSPTPSGNLTATITVTSNWATGFCADITISNNTGSTVNGWTVNISKYGYSTYNTWGANYSDLGNTLALTPLAYNTSIPNNTTISSIGFCANKQTGYTQPTVESVSQINTCSAYCVSLVTYNFGTCRSNTTQCNNNGETNESIGNIYCTAGPSADTCCCEANTTNPPSPLSATINTTSEWATGFCTTIEVTNNSSSSVYTWEVTLQRIGYTTYNTWNGNYSSTSNTYTITPFTWNSTINANSSVGSIGFCADKQSGFTPPIILNVQ